MAAPDLIVTVVGYRAWRILGESLAGYAVPALWERRVLHAEHDCLWAPLDGQPHPAPHPGCACGIHAYHDLTPVLPIHAESHRRCVGAISAWGPVEVHADGFRAAHARVEALALPTRADLCPLVLDLGRRLGVPVVPIGRVEEVAGRAGAPVPYRIRRPISSTP